MALEALHPIIEACPRLVVAIVGFWHGEDTEEVLEVLEQLAVTDSRLVAMAFIDYTEDWEIGARGGDDYWVRAEAFVARKRRGEIQSVSPIVLQPLLQRR